jgi:hypothetical protein
MWQTISSAPFDCDVELEAAAIGMATMFCDRRHRARIQPVYFPRHRAPPVP